MLLRFSSVVAVTMAAEAAAGGPCDIYAAGGTPCVAAHSLTRALYSAYSGALYVHLPIRSFCSIIAQACPHSGQRGALPAAAGLTADRWPHCAGCLSTQAHQCLNLMLTPLSS
jgi:hypothetical protein